MTVDMFQRCESQALRMPPLPPATAGASEFPGLSISEGAERRLVVVTSCSRSLVARLAGHGQTVLWAEPPQVNEGRDPIAEHNC